MIIYWICNLILFYLIASEGLKYKPSEWQSINYASGAWISITVMFIIAVLISFIFGIPLDDILGCTGSCF